MAKSKAKKKAAKKAEKKAGKKPAKRIRMLVCDDPYHNPTRCPKCGYTATVRREGVVCMNGPTYDKLHIAPCDGILVKVGD